VRNLLVPLGAAVLVGCSVAAAAPAAPPPPSANASPSARAPAAPPSAAFTLRSARCVDYAPPRQTVRERVVVGVTRGLELDVAVSDPALLDALLLRDVTPQLFVGEVAVADDARLVEAGVVRFTSYQPDAVPRGGALSLRWPDARGVAFVSTAHFAGCAAP